MVLKRELLLAFIIGTTALLMGLNAQNTEPDSTGIGKSLIPHWNISGFVDSYYAADLLDNTPGRSLQPFLYNHNRNLSFQINLATLNVSVTSDFYRAVVHLQTGTYAIDNYAEEPVLFQTIYEAYAGISLNAHRSLWFDMGVFESHIGYESALSISNPTLTRSLMAENSPYFLTGARLTYEPNPNWLFRIILCNGWQRIQPPEELSRPALGTQITYKWNTIYTLNWSTFIGNVFPFGESKQRIFNNLYLKGDLPSKLDWIVGFDFGFQEDIANNEYRHWYAGSAVVSYSLNNKWKMAIRGERFRDPAAFLTGPNFSAWASSLNVDFRPASQVALRSEIKYLYSEIDFLGGQRQLILTTSIAVAIGAE